MKPGWKEARANLNLARIRREKGSRPMMTPAAPAASLKRMKLFSTTGPPGHLKVKQKQWKAVGSCPTRSCVPCGCVGCRQNRLISCAPNFLTSPPWDCREMGRNLNRMGKIGA
jgi:hypothetical protein